MPLNPYDIGGGNVVLPPEAYPHGIPLPGYGATTSSNYGDPPDLYGGFSYDGLPPAAQGVASGPAYPSAPRIPSSGDVFGNNSYADLSGEPTVIVNQPANPGFNVPQPNQLGLPSWILPLLGMGPQNSDRANMVHNPSWTMPDGSDPVPGAGASDVTAPNWNINARSTPTPTFGAGPDYVSPVEEFFRSLGQANWNKGMWTANPTGGEGPPRSTDKHHYGSLAARLGLMGLMHRRGNGSAGKMPVTFE